ncbi:hypothetical protein KW782_01950 [Candidatus Parcubacteria bacterium]|nr:hypothetical protein [Candidatus Parcubacteria bacterium]
MHKIKHLKLFVTILLFFCWFFSATIVNAQVPFGGLSTGIILPCTCPGLIGPPPIPGSTWQAFTPLYFTPVPLAGAMVVPPVITFPSYTIRPASWGLGFYVPGAGVGCGIFVPNPILPFCIPLPNLGLITPFAGSSLIP